MTLCCAVNAYVICRECDISICKTCWTGQDEAHDALDHLIGTVEDGYIMYCPKVDRQLKWDPDEKDDNATGKYIMRATWPFERGFSLTGEQKLTYLKNQGSLSEYRT